MKRETLVQAVDSIKNISRFKTENLDGLDSYFVFRGGYLSSFSANLSVNVPLDVGFDAIVSSEEFFKFVKKCSGDEISIQLVAGEVIVESGKTKAGFKIADMADKIPESTIDEVKTWMKVPDDFSEALKFCYFSIIDDESQGVINCAYVRPDSVVSTDSIRLTERMFEKKAAKDFSFFIPKRLVVSIADSGCQKIGMVEGMIHIKTENGSIISLNKMMGEYPVDYSKLFDVKGVEIEMPETMIDAINHVATIDSGLTDIQLMDVTIQKKEIVCRVNGEKAWAEEKISYDYKGKTIQFTTSPSFLKDILPKCRKITVGNGVILIKGDNFTHIMSMVV
jgi:DNA polymerase III sliding clamp (beta) subunit (PCNA family)